MHRYNLPADLLASLMKLQRLYYIKYPERNNYPVDVNLDYNIWEYISFDDPLEKKPTSYHLDFPEDKTMSFHRFLELFYFARRRNFGKATVDSIGREENHQVAKRSAGAAKAQGTFSVKSNKHAVIDDEEDHIIKSSN